MKKILFVVLFALHAVSFAVTPECRRNEIDCVGLCGRFIDKNNDGFCDLGLLSQPLNPEKLLEAEAQKSLQDTTLLPQSEENPDNIPGIKKSTTVLSDTADTVENQIRKPDQANPETKPQGTAVASQSDAIMDVAPAPVQEKIDVSSAVSHPEEPLEKPQQVDEQEAGVLLLTEEKEPSGPSGSEKPYNLIFISALTLGSYLITHLLKRFDVISKTVHRRIWNLVLLLTFLISGMLGLLLVVQINYEILGGWYLEFLYLHVEFGISMALVAMIHALWHIRYYALALGIRRGVPETKVRQLTPVRASKRIPFTLLRDRVSARN